MELAIKKVMDIQRLKKRWLSLSVKNGVYFQASEFNDVCEKYTTPQRHYHTLKHINSCLNLFDKIKHEFKDSLAIELALWLHDVIYNPKKDNNEEMSSLYARELLSRVGAKDTLIENVSHLIAATKHPYPADTMEEKYIIDIDLSILGTAMEEYDQYSAQIRKEYSYIPAFLYYRGRKKLLESFLSQNSVFNTEYFTHKFEHQARTNIKREISQLKSS
jgi:predicted metal-dependent HD superfamily phosphohydrolase